MTPPARFAESLARAMRIDAFNRIKAEIAADDCPILFSVFEDYAYGRPPFDVPVQHSP